MTESGGSGPVLCSFCGSSTAKFEDAEGTHVVREQMISGSGQYRICSECIDLASEIMAERIPSWPWQRLPDDTRHREPRRRQAALAARHLVAGELYRRGYDVMLPDPFTFEVTVGPRSIGVGVVEMRVDNYWTFFATAIDTNRPLLWVLVDLPLIHRRSSSCRTNGCEGTADTSRTGAR